MVDDDKGEDNRRERFPLVTNDWLIVHLVMSCLVAARRDVIKCDQGVKEGVTTASFLIFVISC